MVYRQIEFREMFSSNKASQLGSMLSHYLIRMMCCQKKTSNTILILWSKNVETSFANKN